MEDLDYYRKARMSKSHIPTFSPPYSALDKKTFAAVVEKNFERLEKALTDKPIMTNLNAEDFMFMHRDYDGLWFKHHQTRNYICLRSDNEVFIPKTSQAFYRGEFTITETQ